MGSLPGTAPLPLGSLAVGDAAGTLGFRGAGLGLRSHWALRGGDSTLRSSPDKWTLQLPAVTHRPPRGWTPSFTDSPPCPGRMILAGTPPPGTCNSLPPGPTCALISADFPTTAERPSCYRNPKPVAQKPPTHVLLPPSPTRSQHSHCSRHTDGSIRPRM